MTYGEIIQQNCEYFSPDNQWPKYAFHFTDITNAVNIIKEGILYSRKNISETNLMQNDNASRQVIDMTVSGATAFARFYFRPLTPTQYHNEGFKHPHVRYHHDENANIPVPIFFLFDLEVLLNMPKTMFSGESLAGGGGLLQSGESCFAALDFANIYKNGSMEFPEIEKKKRQAEIVYPGSFSIHKGLKYIVCRNDIERSSLLNLLRREDTHLLNEYKDKIIIDHDCFEYNGLYVEDCRFFDDTAVIVYSSTYKKDYYTNKYRDSFEEELIVHASIELEWHNGKQVIEKSGCNYNINYEYTKPTTFTKLKKPEGASALYMKIFFEDKLVCFMCWQLTDAAIL